MNSLTNHCALLLGMLAGVLSAGAVDTEKVSMDRLVGKPADIAPSAYQYRADREPDENPPETEFLFAALGHKKPGVLCGLLWEEPRPVKQVVLVWPETVAAVPEPEHIVLRWFPEGGSASWWCRAGAGKTLRQADQPAVSQDGRVYTYTLDALSNDAALDNLIVAVKDDTKFPARLTSPTVQVLAPQTWKRVDVVIEWGFLQATEKLQYDGRLDVYNGILGKVAPLENDKGTRTKRADAWESRAAAGSRRGIAAQLLYLGYGDTSSTSSTLLASKMDNLLGNANLRGWGRAATHWFAVNSGEAVTVQGIGFPARGVAMHPGSDCVAVAWKSPFDGKVGVRGKATHIQPGGGDGVTWSIAHETAGKTTTLAEGVLDRGGSRTIANVAKLKEIAVRKDDRILLVVGRRGGHEYDSTAVELVITESGGKGRTWDLAGDVAGDVLAGNPLADSHGNAGVWAFVTLPAASLAAAPVWPGQAKMEDVNRTIVTVRTQAGSFSFMPADLAVGPILAPEYGFFVAKAGEPITAAAFRKRLEAQGGRTLRQQIRERAEQSWDGAMRAAHAHIKGEFPPYPQPKVAAPMAVDVPTAHLAAAWKVGAGNMFRGAAKDARGKWRFRDPPYAALAHETHLFMRVLDLMGLHQEARDGYEMWLERVEKPVPTPQGLWTGGAGAFFSGIEWDNATGGGISIIHLGMLEHYCLTRDKAWLTKNAAKLNANADWMVKQRTRFWENISGRKRLWINGLLPPHNIWDNTVWRSWYESNASFCHVIARHAEVIADVDPKAGRRFAEEARKFRKDLVAAVETSLTLSPVIRVRDGTYRSFLPPAPYMRGPASLFMTANFGARAFGMSMHTPGLYADAIRGGQHIAEFGLISSSDPRMQGYLDVLEDRLLSENFKIPLRFHDYDSRKDWFSRSGWYYQAGLERTANIHLRWDDPPSFLRTWLNQYAVEINPGAWTFKEHTAAHGCMDKPFEEAAFLQRYRQMLVMEVGDTLWLARATPRAWLQQGKKISVKNAPTPFGTVAYEIVSDVDHGKITVTVEMPARKAPKEVVLRFRHPKSAPIKGVTVNGPSTTSTGSGQAGSRLRANATAGTAGEGKPWTEFNKDKEAITLKGLTGTVAVTAQY